MKKWSGSLMLLLGAMIWGSAFVAQSIGMAYIGPITFQAIRSMLGVLALLPVIALRSRRTKKEQVKVPGNTRTLLLGGLLCGVVLFMAATLQQMALVHVTAGKAGFLTTIYILIVPILGLLLGRRVPRLLWGCVLLALVGMYLLSVTEAFTITVPDLYLIGCSVIFAVHILLVDHFSPRVDGVKLSCLQFLVAGTLATIGMLLFEQPDPSAILSAWMPLVYVGVFSSGVAYTLQIMGQRSTSPALASLIMSLESVFAMLAGIVVLGQIPSGRELLGSALMFLAITLAQLVQMPRPLETGDKTA
ncbi:MAG: DMT family transporter [Clostridiales bacterium]|nr:DMT family transporter [Clostridiales bacterium]